MKKILLSALLLSSSTLFAADDSTTVAKPKPKPIAKERSFLAYDFSFLSNAGNGIDVAPIRSGGVTFASFFDKPLGHSKLSIAIGAGFSSFNIHSKSFLALDSVGNSYFTPYSDSLSIRRNKLSLNYLEIPVELRFRSKPNVKKQSFKVAVGFKVGWLVQTHTKYKGENPETPVADVIKMKTYDVPNINSLRYGVTARVGFGMFNVYTFYSLNGLFKTDKHSAALQPNAQPFTIGIALTPY